MRILVTGGDGQLGRSLAKIAPEYPEMVFRFTDLPECDITDRKSVGGIISEFRPDIIVNCAAYTAVDKAESDRDTAAAVNTTGPKVLAEICAEAGIRLIHISTDYVFDGTAKEPITEEAAANPTGVYGRTKLDGENAIRESGCDAVIIRTAWLYSEFGNNFVKTMLRLAGEREWLSVVDDQCGTPTYAEDLARAIILFAQKGFKGWEIYHYSDEGVTTWFGFAREIFRVARCTVELSATTTENYPTPARRPAYSVLCKDKIRLAGAAVPPWEESLARCLSEMGYEVNK